MKKLLVVVDFQNDFIDGVLGFDDALKLVGPIKAKILSYQASKDDIIYTLDTHDASYIETVEGENLPVPHCIHKTKGHELHPEVKPLLSSHQAFIKNTFPSLELGQYLKENPYDLVEVVGLVSHICVLSNALMVKSALPNAKIIVDEALTASFDTSLQAKAFDVLEALHIDVIRRPHG